MTTLSWKILNYYYNYFKSFASRDTTKEIHQRISILNQTRHVTHSCEDVTRPTKPVHSSHTRCHTHLSHTRWYGTRPTKPVHSSHTRWDVTQSTKPVHSSHTRWDVTQPPIHIYVVLLGQSFFCELPGHEPSHQRLLGLCVSKFKHR